MSDIAFIPVSAAAAGAGAGAIAGVVVSGFASFFEHAATASTASTNARRFMTISSKVGRMVRSAWSAHAFGVLGCSGVKLYRTWMLCQVQAARASSYTVRSS